jgi:hypothetical protein
MKFCHYKDALVYAKLETIRTHRKHLVVLTRYWSMKTWDYENSYTVVLS